ncbi:MAG: YkgJ family cysteine cluster protein [Cyclobacteriaceae bacterium]
MKYSDDLAFAEKNKNRFKEKGNLLRKLKGNKLDDQFHQLHEEVFENIDCLECANCCKTTSPIFLETDIERVAKALKMKVASFKKTYLMVDEDKDWVLKSSPCPFLGLDNKCIVYNDRPKACREYPHTNRKRMHQIIKLTVRNTLVCPAVSRIFQMIDIK